MYRKFILEKENQNDFDISKIECPFVREVCFLGFIIIEEDVVENKLCLYDKEKKKYEIYLPEWKNLICGLRIKTGFLYTGEVHRWISDANGDGDKFRNFILTNTGA